MEIEVVNINIALALPTLVYTEPCATITSATLKNAAMSAPTRKSPRVLNSFAVALISRY